MQGRSHQVWSGQVCSACVGTLPLGHAPPENFWNLDAMRLVLRAFLVKQCFLEAR